MTAATIATASGCGGGGGDGGDARPGAALTITLEEQNGSGESGTATFTRGTQGTNIVLELMTAAPEGTVQPAGVYEGTCDDVEDATPKIPLPDVLHGVAGATVDASVDELTGEPHALAIRRSTEDDEVVACGEIVRE